MQWTTKRALPLAVLLCAFTGTAGAKKVRTYEHGVLIALSPQYIEFHSPFAGPLAPPAQILVGYVFQIQGNNVTYLVSVTLCCPRTTNHFKVEWDVNNPVEFRLDKDKLFVRRPNGKELATAIRKVVPGTAGPSLSGRELPSLQQPANPRKLLRLGNDLVRSDPNCLLLYGFAEAGDFFEGLTRVQTEKGIQVFRGSEQVETFPESLRISIVGEVGACTAEEYVMKGKASRNLHLDDDFMKSVMFDGSWKQGLGQTPASLGPLATSRMPNPAPATNHHDWWLYQFKVRSEGVSINNSLVIEIQSSDGKMISRLSGRLFFNLPR